VVMLFLIVDLIFFGANIIKIFDGGWFPVLIGLILIFLMSTWKKGRSLLFYKLKDESMSIDVFLKSMKTQLKNRVKGTAVFLTPNPEGVPHSLLHNLKHNKIVHKNVVLLSVRFKNYPHATNQNFIEFEKLPNNFFKVILNYGFKDETRVPRDLKRCEKYGLKLDPMDTSYFIGKESLIPQPSSQMFLLRKKIFITLFRSAENITNQFYLPANRVVELGSQVLF